jgi:hypothetical protein
VKKLKLDDPSTTEFRGIGIVSSEKDYRLCFFFNKELGLDLDKSGNIFRYDPASNKSVPVPCYIHSEPENKGKLYFIRNRQDDFFLIPQMKQADYLFLEPTWQPDKLIEIKKAILNISYIQSCFVIPVQNLKHIDAE